MNFRNWSKWSILHPVPTTMLFVVLVIVGMWGFFNIGIDESPNIDVPAVSVAVTQVGATPEELETQVTRKIEDAVAGIGNIKHISSVINEGVSATTIEFELGTNSDRATNDVRNEVAKVRQQLPQGIDEPMVQRLEFTGGPFITYSVYSPKRSTEELSWLIDNTIGRVLLSVPGVGQVQRSGGVDREIRVNLDPSRLEALGVTADMVSMQLRAHNVNLPGGRGELGDQEQAIRTLGSSHSVGDLAAMQIALPNGRYARLDTLGTISDATADQRQVAMLDGKPIVAFSIVRSMGANMVDVEKKVEAKLEDIERDLPADVKIQRIRSESIFVHKSYEACLEHLVIGSALAVFVIWLFLRDIRSALIAAMAMPMSLIPTFAIIKWAGFTLNNMSLLGLALVIGVLVDDAIVEIENIVRHIGQGKSPFKAALEAADEIGLAVVATTMTLVVVFVPVGFMGGIPGQFLKQFGLTVAVAVLFSLLVARMLTPLIAAFFLRHIPEPEGQSLIARTYDRMLAWSLKHRVITVLAAVAFFGASLVLFKMMPTSLIGNVDRGESLLTLELPPGSTLSETRSTAERLTQILLAREEVDHVFASVGTPTASRGRSGGSNGEVHKATLYVMLKAKEKRKLSQQQFEQAVRPQLSEVPGARLAFTRMGGITGKLRVVLASQDGDELRRTSEAITQEMRGIPGVYDIISTAALKRPEILVKPRFGSASEQGISVGSIARTALIATLGDIDANLPKFNLSDRQINIRVALDPHYRNDPEAIRNLLVAGKTGRLVPLSAVADVVAGSGPAQLNRLDRSRQITIEASLAPNLTLGDALIKVHALPSYKNRPASISDLPFGDVEIQKDIFNGFGTALSAAVMLIYAVLVLLFEGFLYPLSIMMSLPLALGGALMALVVTGGSLGFYALIGIVMLMGLVTKNAILLVEYCLMSMKNGMPRDEAIVEAGRIRMRPILMTTVAMIVGMTPIAIGIGAGAEARAPMAICVIGGLITSTLLTLLVVPVVFTYVDDVQSWVLWKLGVFDWHTRHLDDEESVQPQASDTPGAAGKPRG